MTKTLLVLLALLLPVATSAAAPASTAPVEGVDYVAIPGGQPYAPHAPGEVEVAEVFAWWCPHCFELQPELEAWKATLPRQVRLVYVPAAFNDDAFARAYFAALDAGALPRLQQALYEAVHVDGTLPRNATVDELAAWFGDHGLPAATMRAAMLAPDTDRRVQAAHDFALRSGVPGTPTLLVDGRYRVTGRTRADTLRIARQLADQLRSH